MDNTKVCTSIEQSKRLLELGLDAETADMYWEYNTLKLMCNDYDPNIVQHVPAWSLSALVDVMPSSLLLYPDATEEGVKAGKYPSSNLIASTEGYLRKRFDGLYQYRYDGIKTVGDCRYPIDAAYRMMVWLLEEGKI